MSLLEHGFDTVPDCISVEQCRAILERLQEIDSAGSRSLLQEDWCQELASELQRVIAPGQPELTALLAVQCTYFCKSTDRNWFVSWHQDRSIPVADNPAAEKHPGYAHKQNRTYIQAADEVLERMLAVRLHLDDSNTENGPLRVLPATHRDGTLNDSQVDSARLKLSEEVCLVPAGSALVMRPLLLHASPKAVTNEPRRVLHYLFGPADLPGGLEWDHEVTPKV